MASIRPILFRPIEHVADDSGVDFSIGAHDYALPTGTYANTMSLAWVAALLTSELTAVRLSPTSDGKIELYSASSVSVVFTNTTLRTSLGFASNPTVNGWKTADYLSPFVWIPEHTHADQGRWNDSPSNYFVGAVSQNGNLSGIHTGSTFKSRKITFNWELATNLGRSASTSAEMSNRCLDEFVKGAMTAAPSVSSNANNKGFWFYQDINTAISDCASPSGEWTDSGGFEFSNGDKYCFCNFHPDEPISKWDDAPGFSGGSLRYHVTLQIITAPAPTFPEIGT